MSLSGLLGGLAARLTDSPDRLADRDLADRMRATGSTRIAEVSRGDLATLTGRVRTVSSGGGHDHLGVTAELFDGTGAVDVCWLGRRSIPGIDTGRYLRATGRVGVREGRMIMFNPRYELLAGQPGRTAEENHGRV